MNVTDLKGLREPINSIIGLIGTLGFFTEQSKRNVYHFSSGIYLYDSKVY